MPKPRVPSEIKKAKGTERKCRTNPKEPGFSLIKSVPDPPEYFPTRARIVYNTTGLELINQGILTSVSFDQFIHYCESIQVAEESYKEVEKKGTVVVVDGKQMINPYFKTWLQAIAISRQLAGEFGLTPASSSKVTAKEVKRSKLDEFNAM